MLSGQHALFHTPREVLPQRGLLEPALEAQEAGHRGIARKGRFWEVDPQLAARQYERARHAAARLIGADAEDVALISSVS